MRADGPWAAGAPDVLAWVSLEVFKWTALGILLPRPTEQLSGPVVGAMPLAGLLGVGIGLALIRVGVGPRAIPLLGLGVVVLAGLGTPGATLLLGLIGLGAAGALHARLLPAITVPPARRLVLGVGAGLGLALSLLVRAWDWPLGHSAILGVLLGLPVALRAFRSCPPSGAGPLSILGITSPVVALPTVVAGLLWGGVPSG